MKKLLFTTFAVCFFQLSHAQFLQAMLCDDGKDSGTMTVYVLRSESHWYGTEFYQQFFNDECHDIDQLLAEGYMLISRNDIPYKVDFINMLAVNDPIKAYQINNKALAEHCNDGQYLLLFKPISSYDSDNY